MNSDNQYFNPSTDTENQSIGLAATQPDGNITVKLIICNTKFTISFCPHKDSYQKTILAVYRRWYSWMIGNGMDLSPVNKVKGVVSSLLVTYKRERLAKISSYVPQTMTDMIERAKDKEYENYLFPVYISLWVVTACYDVEIYP